MLTGNAITLEGEITSATLEINLSPEAAEQLHHLSKSRGTGDSETASLLLSDVLRASVTGPPGEKELLANIARGWEQPRWARYHELTGKRRSETLSAVEYSELASLTEEREILNSERLANLIALSELRGVELDDLMKQLDIPNSSIA